MTDVQMERRLRLREERESVGPHRGRVEWRVMLAALIYMPLHEAVHLNIAGDNREPVIWR